MIPNKSRFRLLLTFWLFFVAFLWPNFKNIAEFFLFLPDNKVILLSAIVEFFVSPFHETLIDRIQMLRKPFFSFDGCLRNAALVVWMMIPFSWVIFDGTGTIDFEMEHPCPANSCSFSVKIVDKVFLFF